jgi:hypothetical protein
MITPMKTVLLLAATLALASYAQAQTTTNCGSTPNCNTANQTLGDTTNTNTASNSKSDANQAGNSTNSNASGVTISPSNTGKVAQDATQNTSGTISGGNTTSGATGGSANGNQSSNDNHSSASTGASTSNSGGNKLSTGPSVSASNSGGNKLTTNSTLSGGNNTATNTAKGGAGGTGSGVGIAAGGAGGKSAASNSGSTTGTNAVDASDHSVSNTNVHELFIPTVVPPTPASTLGVGNIEGETSACGPLQRVIKTPVNGSFYGLIKKSKVDLGFTEELAPYLDPNGVEIQYKEVLNPDGSTSYYGHQVIAHTAILGTSGARSIAGGGGAGSGGWAQGGLGSSSSNQQLVTTILLRSCEAERVRPEPIQTSYVPSVPQTQIDTGTPWAPVPDGTLITVNPVVPTVTKPVRSHRKPKHHDPACVTLSVR